MEISRYTAESLEGELREYEDRYGMASSDFFAAYRASGVPERVPYFESFVWADTYEELCRLRAATEPQPA